MNRNILFATLLALLALTVIADAQTNKSKNAEAKNKSQSYVIVVCREADAVEIFDAATLKSLARISVGDAPHEAVSSADGRLAYVANYGSKEAEGNTLSVIDLVALKEIKRINLGDLKRPHGLQEIGGKIYFTAEASKIVGRYDPKTERIDWTAKTDQMVSHMLAVSSDGKKIYTANMLSSSVTAIDASASGEPKVTQINIGKEPEGIALSPDGKTLWIGHRKEGLVTVIDTASGKVTQTLTAGQMPIRMAFSPDGKQVWIISPNEGALLVFDAATRKETGRVEFDGAPVGIVFSPDGSRVYSTDLKNNKVVAIDARKLAVINSAPVETLSDGVALAAKR
jgi:YVTN family beta-propeller protein